MEQSDYQPFRSVMAGMAEMFQRELSDVLLDVYWLALDDWALSEFMTAAKHLMRQNQFMPRPADFTALRKAVELTGAEAWAHVLDNCARWRNGELGDPNPRINAALRAIGGNERVGMCDKRELQWLERRFTEVYEEQGGVAAARLAVDHPQLTSSRRGLTQEKELVVGTTEVPWKVLTNGSVE